MNGSVGEWFVAVVMLVSLVVGLWLQGRPPRNGGSTPNPPEATATNANEVSS